MSQAYKCPCCNDNEHAQAPYHDQLVFQGVEESGAYITPVTYYFCPVAQEMYEDEELQAANMKAVEAQIGRENGRRETNGD